MDHRSLNIFNAAAITAIIAVLAASWLFMRDQFAWGIVLAFLILVFAALVNAMRKMPWTGMTAAEAVCAAGALAILGFAWFYMRDQFCWAGYLALFLIICAIGLRLMKWFRDVVSIQVVVHKKDDGDGGSPK